MTDYNDFKTCRTCEQEFPNTEEFYQRHSSTGKLRGQCIDCTRRKKRDYYHQNKAEISRKSKERYKNNPEPKKERSKNYYHANKDNVKDRHRKWVASNRDKVHANHKRYYYNHHEDHLRWHAEYRSKNRAALRKRHKLWRTNNPEKALAMGRRNYHKNKENYRINAHRRRARMMAAEGSFTKHDIRKMYQSQKGKCWWCGKNLNGKFHVDHRIPLVKGGSNNPSNLVISCAECNLSKNDKLPHEWGDRLL